MEAWRGYGRCPCGGTFVERLFEARLVGSRGPVVLDDVPRGDCPLCGSKVYRAAVLQILESAARDPNAAESAP